MKDVSDIIFTKEECDKIISYSNFNDFSNRHKIYYGTTSTYKSCKLLPSEKTYWVFDRLYSFLEDSLNLKVIKPLEDLMINKYNTNDSFLKHRDLYFKNQIYNIVVNLNDAYLGDGFVLYEPDYTLERILAMLVFLKIRDGMKLKK